MTFREILSAQVSLVPAFESLLCVGKISVTTHPLVLLHCHSFCVHLPSNLAITHLYEPCIITHIPQTAVPRVAQIFRHIPESSVKYGAWNLWLIVA